MSKAYSDEDGKFLVKIARQTVDEYVRTGVRPDIPDDTPDHMLEKSGVFVTLNSVKEQTVSLRGCIGRPYPTQPLIEATIESAVDAAVNDPRFPRVSPKELDAVIVELSVLTPPAELKYEDPEELLDLVKVGRDGLIASQGIFRGLLLPQVPVEYKWDVETFLERTCNKAGLPTSAWKDPKTEFKSFQAAIFGEEEPHGDIVREPEHPRC